MNNKIDNEKFICQNCGKEIRFKMVEYGDPFTKEMFLQCKKEDDFWQLYLVSNSALELFDICCDNPQLSTEDIRLIEDYFELPEELNRSEKIGNPYQNLTEVAKDARDYIGSFKQGMTQEERGLVKRLDDAINKV